MNGKVAKRLRKQFPETKTEPRKYTKLMTEKKIVDDKDKEHTIIKTTVVALGSRSAYLAAKDSYGKRK